VNRILALILIIAVCAGLTACQNMPASQADMDRLGARLEQALIEQKKTAVPVPPPAIADRKYTRTFTTNGGKTISRADDGTESIVANNYQETLEVTLPAGTNPNGIYDPGLPWPAVLVSPPTTPQENLDREIRRLRGSNGDKPPFFTASGDTRSPTPEERRRFFGTK
jgi:hypothetical protein